MTTRARVLESDGIALTQGGLTLVGHGIRFPPISTSRPRAKRQGSHATSMLALMSDGPPYRLKTPDHLPPTSGPPAPRKCLGRAAHLLAYALSMLTSPSCATRAAKNSSRSRHRASRRRTPVLREGARKILCRLRPARMLYDRCRRHRSQALPAAIWLAWSLGPA
jgi:hypothetical protein